jgi:hypothetical protein
VDNLGQDFYYYYILMTNPSPNTNTNSNTTTTECNHPPSKVILTPEGEYVCNACGVVLTLDQAAERGRYLQSEVKGYIDPRGKTKAWLLTLGSTIPTYSKEGKRLTEISEEYVDGKDHSKLANVIADLGLEGYGTEVIQHIVYAFNSYCKTRRDSAISTYIAVKLAVIDNNLPITDARIREVIKRYFNVSVQFIPSYSIQHVASLARLYGARKACRMRRYYHARRIRSLLYNR